MLPNFDHIWPLFGQETNIALLDSLEFCMHVVKLSKRVKPGPYVSCLHESEKEWLKQASFNHFYGSGVLWPTTGSLSFEAKKLEFFSRSLEFFPIKICVWKFFCDFLNFGVGNQILHFFGAAWRKYWESLNSRYQFHYLFRQSRQIALTLKLKARELNGQMQGL